MVQTVQTVLENAITLDDAPLDSDNSNAAFTAGDKYLIFWETAENSGVFVNTDDADSSNLKVTSAALRGTTATIDYNDSAQSFVVAHDFATIDMDALCW